MIRSPLAFLYCIAVGIRCAITSRSNSARTGPSRSVDGHGADRPEFRCQMTALFLFDGTDLTCERVYFDAGTTLRQLTA
jgi:hypothetical protein